MSDFDMDQPADSTADADVAPDVAALRAALSDAQKKSEDYYDQLLRLRAEFDNFRKRTEKEKADARDWGKQEILMPLLNLVDVFEQALNQVQHAKDMRQVQKGLEFLHKNFSDFLKAEGLESLQPVGKPFDPHMAEAVEQQEVADEKQVGTVLAELQKGYRLKDRLLRPSQVRVGVAKPTAEKTD
ncbi:MAG TPA: nucleotide exchange factor GrpE [Elusimicrobiota bacterium]|nr:nucleotide exchange factor GrpE [Elusimicrobiota bacterium]